MTASLPAGLRERVMAATHDVRPAGLSLPEVSADSPAEAFSHAADAFYRTLCVLRDGDWRLPVLRDLDVQGLVGHLIGVENDVQRAMSGDPGVASADHVQSTQPVALGQAGRPPAATRADWRRAADRTLAQLRDLDAVVALHGFPLPVRDLLVARTFELWTHENDIRTAAWLPLSAPAPSTLRPMTRLATALLPFGAALSDLREPISVHLVLTGARRRSSSPRPWRHPISTDRDRPAGRLGGEPAAIPPARWPPAPARGEEIDRGCVLAASWAAAKVRNDRRDGMAPLPARVGSVIGSRCPSLPGQSQSQGDRLVPVPGDGVRLGDGVARPRSCCRACPSASAMASSPATVGWNGAWAPMPWT